MTIAAVNGPSSTVIAGDEAEVLRIAGYWRADGCRTNRLRVSHAFHSHHMDDVLAEFRAAARTVTFEPP